MSEGTGDPAVGGSVEGEEIPPVEIQESDLDLVSEDVRRKIILQVDQLSERLGDLSQDSVEEIEGIRRFSQDLSGKYDGYRVVVSVSVALRKNPD